MALGTVEQASHCPRTDLHRGIPTGAETRLLSRLRLPSPRYPVPVGSLGAVGGRGGIDRSEVSGTSFLVILAFCAQFVANCL